MLPNSTDITYFIEVAEKRNLTRAAERLGISQPTLSLAMKKLEHTVGIALLVRSKSGVQLTHYGERFYSEARALLSQWERIRKETLLEKTEVRGRFTIGCHPSVAMYGLTSFLPKLLSDFKNLEISLIHDLSRKITEKIISFQVDFGIVVNPVQHPDLVITELYKDEVTFWSRPENQNEDVLICDPDLIQTQTLLKKMKKSKLEFKRIIYSSNLEVVRTLVAAGCGVGILPGRVVGMLEKSKLHHFGKNPAMFYDRICLIYRVDVQKGNAADTIIKTIRESK